jgi:hypothetical protein
VTIARSYPMRSPASLRAVFWLSSALADLAIARTECPALSTSFTVSMPIPLLAPVRPS